MYVRVRYNGKIEVIPVKSKLAPVDAVRKEVEKVTGVKRERQRLFHMGKQLEDRYTLFDYDIKINSLIEVSERVVVDKSGEDEKENVAKKSEGSSSGPPSGGSAEGEKAVKIEDIYDGNPNDLLDNNGYDCKRCRNDLSKPCKICGCNICGLKDRDEMQLMCDECEYYHHIDCLDPPLEKIPDGDWYCPECKNDENEIVNAGSYLKQSKKKSKMPSAKKACKRDWGNGFATVGRSKTCTKVPSDHFGPIPGIDVGMCWKYRIQLSEEGVHRPPVAGIAGKPSQGSQSIVLSGGFAHDADHGEEFFYSGSGGCDLSGNKRTGARVCDQELTKSNLALAVSCHARVNAKDGAEANKDWKKGKPVRVVRTEKFGKHSKFAPKEGCR